MESGARVVVVQDSGLRAKTPLFDSQSRLLRDRHHTPAEIANFVFGAAGMAMSDHSSAIKIHHLPSLPALPSSVLISRLFSIDPDFKTRRQPHHSCDGSNSDDLPCWNPEPLLDSDDAPLNESQATRFAIAVVVPILDPFVSLRDTITENWLQISHALVNLESLIINKFKNIHYTSTVRLRKPKSQHFQQTQQPSTPITPHGFMLARHQSQSDVPIVAPCSISNQNQPNKRLNFVKYCLQGEIDIHHSVVSMSKMITILTKTSRLFYNLKYSNQTLITWASNVSAWMTLKDVAPIHSHQSQTYFLTFVLSVLLPVRDRLFDDPLDKTHDDVIRLVIGTNNPVISEKLVYILAGLLGYEKYSNLYDHLHDILNSAGAKDKDDEDDNNNDSAIDNITIPQMKNLKMENSASEPRSLSCSSNHAFSQPIPFNREQSPSYFGMASLPSPSPNSRGWSPSFSQSYKNLDSISVKSGLGMATTAISNDVGSSSSPKSQSDDIAHSKSIPINSINAVPVQPSLPSLQRSSSYVSLQNISESYATPTSSLGGHLTAGGPNSWRNLGSWIDRWKWVSTNSSPRQHSKASLGSSYGRNTFNGYDTRTPSPYGTVDNGLFPRTSSSNDMVNTGGEDTTLVDATSNSASGNQWQGEDEGYFNGNVRSAFSGEQQEQSLIPQPLRVPIERTKSVSYGFGNNYQCQNGDNNAVERSVGNLKTVKYEKMTKSIGHFIDELMDIELSRSDDNSYENNFEKLGINVLPLEYPKNNDHLNLQMEAISSTTIIRLPLLVGYIPDYLPEFTLMACPVTNPSVSSNTHNTNSSAVLESNMIKSLRDDVSRGKKSSKLWFVNGGMRVVKQIDAISKHTHQQEQLQQQLHKDHQPQQQQQHADILQGQPVRPTLSMRSLSSNGVAAGLDLSRSYGERMTSNLTSYLQRSENLLGSDVDDIDVNQKIVFSSNSFKSYDYSANENLIEIINDSLMKITDCINNFLEEVDESSDIANLEKDCCTNLRSVIEKLLSSYPIEEV